MTRLEMMIKAIQEAESYFLTLGQIADPEDILKEAQNYLGEHHADEIFSDEELLNLILASETQRDELLAENQFGGDANGSPL